MKKLTFLEILKAGGIAGVISAIINAILFYIANSSGIITDDILLPANNEPMTVVPIVLSSLIPSILGAIVYYFIQKYSTSGLKVFQIISVVLLFVSFVNPFMIPNVTAAYAIALNIMHIVVVASLLFFFSKLNQPA